MKKVLAFLLCFNLIFFCLSCSKAEGFQPRYDKDTACEITIVGHYDNFEALESEIERFNEYYPNVDITYIKLDNYKKIIQTTLKSDDSPDIFFTFTDMIDNASYAEMFDMCEDLGDKNTHIDLSNIREGLLYKDAAGHIPMIPVYITTYGMMVNEDLFEKERLTVPKTYDELLSVCASFKNAGYDNPILGCHNDKNMVLYPMYYPYFLAQIADDDNKIAALNQMTDGSGEYIRSSLDLIDDFMSKGYLDLEDCNLKDDYEEVILKFFEGEIPMMLASGNTVSGTKKRESKSPHFSSDPFDYSFYPVPSTDKGGYFLNTISLCFSANKNSKNLDMVNEFLSFLARTEELSNMSMIKRMITPTTDMSLDNVYSSFEGVTSIYTSNIELTSNADAQVRLAAVKVCNGEMTVDEAVSEYGRIK